MRTATTPTQRLAVLAALASVCAAGLTAVSGPTPARSDDPGKALADAMMAKRMDPKGMERWMESMKPGLAHEFLASFEGEWKTTTRMFMEPGAPPMESKGTSSARMILGGRFLEEKLSGEMMGQPLEGMGLTGFDNNTQLFVSTWCDSLNTGITMSHGSIDQTGRVLTYVGSMNEPMTGEIGKAIKMVLTRTDEDHHLFEMFEVLYGEQFKVFEIEYARVK